LIGTVGLLLAYFECILPILFDVQVSLQAAHESPDKRCFFRVA
jgi:hypothetical protein